MPDLVLAVAIGFVAGVLSGGFGIGGGVIMVPALRILLGVDGLTAVGTSLPVIFPSALTGAISYARAGSVDLRGGLRLGLFGMPAAILGAFLAEKVGGTAVLLVLSVVIGWMAADTILQIVRPKQRSIGGDEEALSVPVSAGVGGVTGLYSGFLGLGGGFIMVPLLTRWGRMSIKRAIGTSLVAILLLAIPGTLTHYAYGNTDVRLSLALMLGVVPGALLGSRITLGANERSVRIAFAGMLVVTGMLLIAKEMGWL